RGSAPSSLSPLSLHDALPICELAAPPGDGADVLVAHDHRGARRRGLVELDVGAADPGDLHPQEGAVLGDVRHGKLAHLGPAGTRSEEHTSELQSLAYLVCRLL